MLDPCDIVDAHRFAGVCVPEVDECPAGRIEVPTGDEEVDVAGAAVLPRPVQQPSEGRAFEKQGLNADRREGSQHLDGSRVELGLSRKVSKALNELVEFVTGAQVSGGWAPTGLDIVATVRRRRVTRISGSIASIEVTTELPIVPSLLTISAEGVPRTR